MIWCVEQAELEQDVPETIADALLRLEEEEEAEKKRLEQIPPPSLPTARVDIAPVGGFDNVGPSKLDASPSKSSASSASRLSTESPEESDEEYEPEAKTTKTTKTTTKVPMCRRSVPQRGKGKGKGKVNMERARKAQKKKDEAESSDADEEVTSDEGGGKAKTKKKRKKKRKEPVEKVTSDATSNPIGVGKARESKGKGKGKGKGKRKGPGAALKNRADDEPFTDEGEYTPNEDNDLDEDFDEAFPIDVMPDLDRNAPREDDYGDNQGEGIENLTTFHDLEWGDEDDTLDRDRVLKGKPSWGGSETPGTTRIAGAANMSLLQIFLLLFPLKAIDRIVNETNLYASIAISKSWYPNARAWVPITTGELMVWIGICIGMGVFQLDNYTLFWSGLGFGAFHFPDISKCMPMYRWEQIKRFLHLKSNVGRPPMNTRQGRLWQCGWLEELLTQCAKACWNPSQDMCMDERSIPSRHKYNPIRVFNPNKPHKFACNQQSLVDSKGYQYHSWMYDRIKRVGLKVMIVELFCACLPHRGFKLAADRWYGSTNAPQICAHYGHSWTSTLIKSYVPAVLKTYTKKNMESGESHFVYCEDINSCITVWKDKNMVYSISNELRPYGGFVARNVGVEVDPRRPAPEMIVWYNEIKAMVDGFDGKCLGMGSLEMAITSHKWWHCMFFGLLDGVLVNLDIIARSVGVSKDRFQTLIELSTQLQMNHMDQDVSHRTRNTSSDGRQDRTFDTDTCSGPRSRFYGDHYSEMNPNGKKSECVVCRANNFGVYVWKRRKEGGEKFKMKKAPGKPRNWCKRCGIHLCVGKCFEDYHTKQIEHLDTGNKRQKMPPGQVGVEGESDEEI